MKILRVIVSAALFAGSAAIVPVQAADQVVTYSDGSACADAHVLGRIIKNFDYQVRHVPNLPNVAITDFQNIHQSRYVPAEEDSPVARRYCAAKVVLSDGERRDVSYLIEEGMGFATLADGFGMATETKGSNVEFCVSGFDRWMVYNGACRVLR